MVDETLRDNLKNVSIGVGLTLLILSAGLALAFW